jgi:hypothetical protein
MKTTLPFIPYDERYVLVPANLVNGESSNGGRGITFDPDRPKPDIDIILRGFNDLSKQLRDFAETSTVPRESGRSLNRENDFDDVHAPKGIVPRDLENVGFEAGCIRASRMLQNKKSSKEELLAAFYYQLGAMTGAGFATTIDPEDALASPENVTRSCESRGSCADLGRDIDRLIEKLSKGSRGDVFREIGEWADKVRDCVTGG